jgi:hypothetical protein
MASFSYVKALETEIADLKAEIVELSGKLEGDLSNARDEAVNALSPSKDVVATAMFAGLAGLVVGHALGSRRPWRPRF